MAGGLSFKAFAGVIGVSRRTLYNWAGDEETPALFPEFAEAHEIGISKYQLFMERLLLAGAQGVIKDFNNGAIVWLTKNILHWTDKSAVELTGKDGAPLEMLSDEALEKIAKSSAK